MELIQKTIMSLLGYDLSMNTENSTLYQNHSDNELVCELLPEWICELEYTPWLWAVFGSILVGLSGVLPLLIIDIDQTDNLKQGDNANTLKRLLSFAVGGLLGDVFLHSLPEIWANDVAAHGGHSSFSGMLILLGLIMFVSVEKIFSVIEKVEEEKTTHTPVNNNTKGLMQETKKSTGYLNLVANTLDNFTHGLSLGGAFLVSFKLGSLTTFAILVHEIPHEVGDFAILLKSGFTRWHAGVFQLLTAGGGLVGAMAAIVCSGASTTLEVRGSWILPFTAGSFLHIALVTVLPDLLKEEDPKESFYQLFSLLVGILIMGFVTEYVG